MHEYTSGETHDQSPPSARPRSNATRCQSRKRKHSVEGSSSPRRTHIDAADAAGVELGDRSPECSEPSSADELPEGGSDRSTKLSAALRAKLHMIGDTVTLATIEDYVNYTATPPSSADDCAHALEGDAGLDRALASDHRARVLKDRIVQYETAERSVEHLKVAIRISKRLALAVLIGKYLEERDARTAMPKKRRKKELPRLSPMDRFTDLLFPETKGTEERGEESKEARKRAKTNFSYWISLGEPLARMAQ